jgi:hypothetical protein
MDIGVAVAAQGGAPSASIPTHPQTLANQTISAGQSAIVMAPITIPAGVTITIAVGGYLRIIQ